jgi:hypothetical protein
VILYIFREANYWQRRESTRADSANRRDKSLKRGFRQCAIRESPADDCAGRIGIATRRGTNSVERGSLEVSGDAASAPHHILLVLPVTKALGFRRAALMRTKQLAGEEATIDRHSMPHHEAGGRTAKPYHGSGDLFRLTEASDGCLCHHPAPRLVAVVSRNAAASEFTPALLNAGSRRPIHDRQQSPMRQPWRRLLPSPTQCHRHLR